MDTKVVTIQLVKDLMASESGLLPYTLYKRYGVTPIVLVQIVKRLQEKGYLQIEGSNRLMLTKKGRANAEGLLSSLSKAVKGKMDSAYFIRITCNVLDRRMPFLPSRKFFEFYNQYIKEGVKNG